MDKRASIQTRERDFLNLSALSEPSALIRPRINHKEMGRCQGRSTYNKMKSNTASPEPSQPPTSRPEHQKLEEAEENSLMNNITKKVEACVEEKTKKEKNAVNN